MTTKDMVKFKMLHQQGMSDVAIAQDIGCSVTTVRALRHRMHLPVTGGRRPTPPRVMYTVYLAKDDQLVAYGPARSCAKAMGMSLSTFRTIASRAMRGMQRKYIIIADPYQEEAEECLSVNEPQIG